MKKVKITEAQFIKLVLENEIKETIVDDVKNNIVEDIHTAETGINTLEGGGSGDSIVEKELDPKEVIEEKIMNSSECKGDDLFESIDTTKGGLNVRNLLFENEIIKGEYKSPYGQWHKIEWDVNGTALNIGNKYNEFVHSIKLDEAVNKKDFYTKERESLAKKDEALPDGSFPIRNKQDLKDAIRSFGRAKDKEKAKSWITKRAKELKLSDLIPEKW